MKVLVCGSRSWDNEAAVRVRLGALPEGSSVIHGGARGADIAAYWACLALDIPAYTRLPDWKTHGKRAGILRNLAMLDERPDLVIAFWDGKSRGTLHTVTEARKRGIPVEVIT